MRNTLKGSVLITLYHRHLLHRRPRFLCPQRPHGSDSVPANHPLQDYLAGIVSQDTNSTASRIKHGTYRVLVLIPDTKSRDPVKFSLASH